MAEQTGASTSPHQPSPLLIEHPETGDCYFTGDLTAGHLLAENDGRIVKAGRHPSGVYWVHLNDSPDPNSTAEWGHGASLEEAFRYALGAMFGPIDSEYDEDHLRWVLDHTIR